MTDGPELFPVAIGRYKEFADLDVESEVVAVAELFVGFNGYSVAWDLDMAERNGDAVDDRLGEWSERQHPYTILYWVGHGWSDDDRASLAHSLSPRAVKSKGITPEKMADVIADRSLVHPGAWAIVVVDACKSKRFIQLLKAEINNRPGNGQYLFVGGMSGEGATRLGKFSRELGYILNTTCAADYEIELRDIAHHLESVGAEVEQKRLVDAVLRRKHAVLVNVPLDVRDELDAALANLSDDELRHFLPKAHGGEMPFKETVLGEQSWYFEGRREETRSVVEWLQSDRRGMFVVTGPAGSGKSALLGHLVVHSNPTLRMALHRTGVLGGLSEDQRPADGAFDLVLHLTGASSDEVIARIAEGIGAGEPPTRNIREAVAWLGQRLTQRPMTILVDALDEAVEPMNVAREVLRELASFPALRLLIGTRASTLEDPDRAALDTGLLDALRADRRAVLWLGRDGVSIRRYVRRRLGTAVNAGKVPESFDVDDFAAAVDGCRRHFLFARLAVHEALADERWQAKTRWKELLGGDHRHLFETSVNRLATMHPVNRTLLRALAFARGRGLPEADSLWADVAQALTPHQIVERADIDRLTKTAAPYILADRESGQTVYRLAHRTFAEYFTNEREPSDDDRNGHLAITKSLAASTAAKVHEVLYDSQPLNSYITRYLSAHAGSAGESGWNLLDDYRGVLAALEPARVAEDALRTAFGRFDLPVAIAGVLTSCDWLESLSLRHRPVAQQFSAARQTGSFAGRESDRDYLPKVALRWAKVRPSPPHRVLSGHTSEVSALAAVTMPDGRTLLATGGWDGAVRLWDPVTGRPIGEPFVGSNGRVGAMAVVPPLDGRTLIAVGTSDGTVRLWDLVDGRPVGAVISLHTQAIGALAAATLADGRILLATGSDDGSVRLWDLHSDVEVSRRSTQHLSGVGAMAAIPQSDGGTLLAIGCDDRVVRLWDPATGRLGIAPAVWHEDVVSSVATVPIPGGQYLLATGSLDGAVRLLNPNTRRLVAKPLRHPDGVAAVAAVPIGPDHTLLATGCVDGSVRLWDPLTYQLVGQPFRGHSKSVGAIAALPIAGERTVLATGSADRTVRLWDPARLASATKEVNDRLDSFSPVQALASVLLTKRTSALAIGRNDGTVRLVDEENGRLIGQLSRPSGARIHAVVALLAGDGSILVAAGDRWGSVHVWDPVTCQLVSSTGYGQFPGLRAMTAIAGSGTSDLLAVACDESVEIWDPLNNRSIGGITARNAKRVESIAEVRLLHGHAVLATANKVGAVRLWDPNVSQRTFTRVFRRRVRRKRLGSTVPVVGISEMRGSDGRRLLIAASRDGTLQMWDLVTGRRVGSRHLDYQTPLAALAVLSRPNKGSVVATGSLDGVVSLWDTETDCYQLVHVGARIESMCVTGDGAIALGLDDGVALLEIWAVGSQTAGLSTDVQFTRRRFS